MQADRSERHCWVCRGRGTIPGVYGRDRCPNCCERDFADPLYPGEPNEWLELAAALSREAPDG